jgi:hypothetical protein
MPLLSSCSHGAITLVRGRNVTYAGCWNRCTEFHATCHPPIGVCERALFVLDRQGIIAWSDYCSPIAVNPGADGIADALEKLSDQAKSHGQLENADHAK